MQLMLGYGVFDLDYLLPFASSLFIETLETSPGQFGIRLVLRNGTTDVNPQILPMPGT